MAIFRTEAGFKIRGRGFVIAGDITEGTIYSGKRITGGDVGLLHGKVIKACEHISNIRTRTSKIGLLLSHATKAEQETLLQLDWHDKYLEIED